MTALAEIAHELRVLDVSRSALRQFGLVVGGVFLAIVVVVLWRRGWDWTPVLGGLAGFGGLLVVLGALVPVLLRPVYRVWMGLAVALGYVMTRVILSLLYVLAITPVGWIRRTFGDSPVLTAPKTEAKSYWMPKPAYEPHDRERLERYF